MAIVAMHSRIPFEWRRQGTPNLQCPPQKKKLLAQQTNEWMWRRQRVHFDCPFSSWATWAARRKARPQNDFLHFFFGKSTIPSSASTCAKKNHLLQLFLKKKIICFNSPRNHPEFIGVPPRHTRHLFSGPNMSALYFVHLSSSVSDGISKIPAHRGQSR